MLVSSPPSTNFGGPIPAEVARHIACDSKITPIILGGKGEILDVGRSGYTFPAGIRKAMEARDRDCTFPGCDRPPGWTEAHHIIPFSVGGQTRLSSAAQACDHHHYLLHHGDWEIRIADDGIPEYLPPRWMDFHRTPRRNTRFS
ncbi:HNH endonuclease [Nakamurella silvestris]|nr:HNH endonuclease [Nakamurella silvestris]